MLICLCISYASVHIRLLENSSNSFYLQILSFENCTHTRRTRLKVKNNKKTNNKQHKNMKSKHSICAISCAPTAELRWTNQQHHNLNASQ